MRYVSLVLLLTLISGCATKASKEKEAAAKAEIARLQQLAKTQEVRNAQTETALRNLQARLDREVKAKQVPEVRPVPPPRLPEISLVRLDPSVKRTYVESFPVGLLGEMNVGEVGEFKFSDRGGPWIIREWRVNHILNAYQVLLHLDRNYSVKIVAQTPTMGMVDGKLLTLRGKWEVSGTIRTGGQTFFAMTQVSR